jgi:hypothetical protein
VTEEAFEEMLKKEAGRTYDNYGDIASELFTGKTMTQAEEDRAQR